MSDERDELAAMRGELAELTADAAERDDDDWMTEAATAILAAGYRKSRTVTTAEELDTLPSDAVIRSVYGAVFVKDGGYWAETGTRDKSMSADLDLPAAVLHEGADL